MWRLLNVCPSLAVATKAIIPEGPEVFIRSGSTIHLSCVITGPASPSAYVFWYRDGSVINYDSPRGRVRVTTDKGKTTVSRLQIAKARATDGGDYACKPSYSETANVTIHIISFTGSCHSSVSYAISRFRLPGGNHQAVQQSDPVPNSATDSCVSSLLTSSAGHPLLFFASLLLRFHFSIS